MVVIVSRGRHFVPRAGQPEVLMTMLVGVPGNDRWVRGAVMNQKCRKVDQRKICS